MLSAAKHLMVSAQESTTNTAVVQDSLLGAYRMTIGVQKITQGQFFGIAMNVMEPHQILKKIQKIRKTLRDLGLKAQCYTGKGLISLILPEDFNYEKRNNADANEPTVKIHKGVLYEGAIDKQIIGSSHSSIIHTLHKEYGVDEASRFVDHIQFVTNGWLLITSFSIGLGDCLVQGEDKKRSVDDIIQKCFMEAEGIEEITSSPAIRELRVTAALNKAKDIGLRIAKDALVPTNNFLSTVRSGSKGDFFNIAQITGLLGQQNLQGKRVSPVLNNKKRTLPHYPMSDLNTDQKYESRGFVASSFIHGLNPKEFYFHAMSGREGVCDTAMGTATSGYMQRRIVKLTEDMQVQYDGTLRDTTGRIYSFAYGDDGMNPSATIRCGNKHNDICNISRIVDRLNMTTK
jgi:DNA-directed RNA polymerase II subunit RPB1